MPRASDFPLLLPAIREDLRDYRIPGSHLHGPLARGVARLPSGREVTAPGDGDALGGAPAVMLWPWGIFANGVNTSVAVSPPITGLAVVDFLHVVRDNLNNVTPHPTIHVGYNTGGGGQGVDALGQVPAFATIATTLFTTPSRVESIPGDNFKSIMGLPKHDIMLIQQPWTYPLGVPIDEQRFFLVVGMEHSGAGGHKSMGYVRIVHNLTREQFRNFL